LQWIRSGLRLRLSPVFAFGQIFFGHFELHTAKWRRVLKIVGLTVLACAISTLFGRGWVFVLLGALLGFFIVIHAWWLPKKGINGWTAEPREKYYLLRGWTLKD
jgi:hypothetical protein